MKKWLVLGCVVVLFLVCIGGVGTTFMVEQSANGTILKAGPVVPKPEPWQLGQKL